MFEGEHIPLATLPGMAERTVSIHSMSKTYSVTGWRIGWTIAPPDLSVGIRRVHDFLTVGAAAPLQAAAVVALGFPRRYYDDLVAGYRARRDLLAAGACETAGFRVHEPAGAYYVMTDIRTCTDEDDVTFALRLIRDPGVAAVPGSSFFSRPELGRTKLRFAFPKRLETLAAAAERLASRRVPRGSSCSGHASWSATVPRSRGRRCVRSRAHRSSKRSERVRVDDVLADLPAVAAVDRPGRSRPTRRPRA